MTTWNPSDTGGGITFSDNNLTVAATNSSWFYCCRATTGKSTGKWYWENKINDLNYCMFGIATSEATLGVNYAFAFNVYGYGYHGGYKFNNSIGTYYGESYSALDVIGVALDCDNHTVTFYKNGVSLGVAFSSLPNSTYYPAIAVGLSITSNFGASSFAYSIPSGYSPINEATIINYLQKIPHNTDFYRDNKVELLNIANRKRIGIVGTTKHNYIGA